MAQKEAETEAKKLRIAERKATAVAKQAEARIAATRRQLAGIATAEGCTGGHRRRMPQRSRAQGTICCGSKGMYLNSLQLVHSYTGAYLGNLRSFNSTQVAVNSPQGGQVYCLCECQAKSGAQRGVVHRGVTDVRCES